MRSLCLSHNIFIPEKSSIQSAIDGCVSFTVSVFLLVICSFDDNILLDLFLCSFVGWLGRKEGGGYATGMERVSSLALNFSTSLSNLFTYPTKKKKKKSQQVNIKPLTSRNNYYNVQLT